MRLVHGNYIWLAIGLGGILVLSGCGSSSVQLDSQAHEDLLRRDRTASGQSEDKQNQVIELSLAQAIERGLTHNLDARVAALEALSQQDSVTLAQLQALPGVDLSGGYVGRSNLGASSSRSILTGQQSLEPSQSTEQHRRVASLEASWNLLDAALALADAAKADEEAKIAGERYNKVVQNVERDVYTAYWRALAYQSGHEQAQKLLHESSAYIDNLDNAAAQKLVSSDQAGEKMAMLAERQRTLRDLHDRMQLAEVELKGMLSLPLGSKLILTSRQKDVSSDIKKLMAEDISAQEWAALKIRPEMREEILKRNVTLQDTRREILQTFPGMDLVFSKEYDSNKYLVDTNWSNFSAKIVQSVTSLFTLPARYNAAKNKEAVAGARRQALNSAILAQVHIARARLVSAGDMAKTNQIARKSASRKSHGVAGKASQGMATQMDAMLAQLDYQIESMRADMAYADMQDAYAAMKMTLGRPLIEDSLVIASAERRGP
jgi:multidrug efflux system outer membrane protein